MKNNKAFSYLNDTLYVLFIGEPIQQIILVSLKYVILKLKQKQSTVLNILMQKHHLDFNVWIG